MIPKVKTYLTIAGVLFVAALSVTNYLNHKKYLREKAERIRQENNVAELLAKDKANIALNLTQSEYISSLSSENESLLKQLQIKPKTVVKHTTITIRDTSNEIKPMYLVPLPFKTNAWHFEDIISKCVTVGYDVFFEGDSIRAQRTHFSEGNSIDDIFFRKRVFKLWFIEIYSGKKIIQQTSSECGEVMTKTVQVIKR